MNAMKGLGKTLDVVLWVVVGIWSFMCFLSAFFGHSGAGFRMMLFIWGLVPLIAMIAKGDKYIPRKYFVISLGLVLPIFISSVLGIFFFMNNAIAELLCIVILTSGFFIWSWSKIPTGAYSGRFMELREADKFKISRQEEAHTLTAATLNRQPIGIKPYAIAKIQKELGHLTVVAPTRSGKGLLLTSHLLTWAGSAITLDIKGENWQRTSAERAKLGPVYVLNPEGFGARFDPIAELVELGADSESALLQAANVILRPEDEKQPIFPLTALPALRAGMRVAYALKEPVLPWIYAQTRSGLRAYVRNVQAQAERLNDWASIDDMTQFLGRPLAEVDEAQWSDARWLPGQAWANLTASLGRVCTEGVLKMTSGRDFTAADLKKSPASVYLIWKEDMGEGLRDAFSLVSLALLKGLGRYADDHKGQPMTEVLFIVDEAGTFKVPDLPKLMATLAGRGVWLSPYFQNVVQMQRQYGENAEQEIINNSSAVVWYPSAESSAGEYVEQFSGKKSVMTSSSGSQGATFTTTDRPVITASEFSQMGENAVLVQFRNHAWLKAQPMRWLDFPHLKERAGEKGVNGGPIAWNLNEYRSRITPTRPTAQAQAVTSAPATAAATVALPASAAPQWYGLDDDEDAAQELN